MFKNTYKQKRGAFLQPRNNNQHKNTMKNETKQKILTALEEYLEKHSMSQNVFAQKSGVNVAYISAIRNLQTKVNAGNGTSVEIADKHYQLIAEFIGFSVENTYWQTVPTLEMKRIIATLEDAKEFAYTNLIIGETGSGKTYCTNLFAQANPIDVFMITVGSTDNIGDLLDKIIEKTNIPAVGKTRSKKINDILKYFKRLKLDGYKPMIIFDEAEYMKQPALCSMKEFYDNLQGIAAIILVGTDQLTRNLDKLRKRNKEGVPQFYRRIKFGIRILPSIDRNFKQFLNDVNDAGLVRFLRENCENYGELHDVLVPAMREAERTGQELTESFVRTILNFQTQK